MHKANKVDIIIFLHICNNNFLIFKIYNAYKKSSRVCAEREESQQKWELTLSILYGNQTLDTCLKKVNKLLSFICHCVFLFTKIAKFMYEIISKRDKIVHSSTRKIIF